MTTKRALVYAPLMPEYDRESGSKRIFDLVLFLREAGWAVSFVAENGRGGDRYARALRQRGVATYVVSDSYSRVAELIAVSQFDLAIIAFWYTAESCLPMIRHLSPETSIVVDTIDLQFLRQARRTFLEATERGDTGALDTEHAAELAREVNVYAAADAVLTVSQKEADMINDLVGCSKLAHVVPDSEDLEPASRSFAERSGMLFVGNFRHPPNVQAAEYLCREIVPRIRPAITTGHPVYVVGNGLDGKVRDYGRGLADVRMVGWVPSIVPYLQRCRVAVVPVRYGAGTKRKAIQALMVGTPTVSTSVGIEGLNLCDGEHVLVADDPAAFADAVERLLTDEVLWRRLARQGREQIGVAHGREAARTRLMQVLAAVLERRSRSRRIARPDVTRGRAGRPDPQMSARRAGAYLVATPNPVPAGSEPGATTIVWSTGSGERGEVRLAEVGRAETIFAVGATGAEEAPWIRSGRMYEFRLYGDGDRRELLAAVTVVGSVDR